MPRARRGTRRPPARLSFPARARPGQRTQRRDRLPEARTSSSAVIAPSRRRSRSAAAAGGSGALSGTIGSRWKSSRMSPARVTGTAPSRMSAFVPRGKAARDLSRNREHVSPLLQCEVGRDQRAAPLARLDDDRRLAEPGDDPVPRGKSPRRRLDAGLVLGDDQAALADPSSELGVGGRVVAVDPTSEHRDRHAGLERAAMRLAVDSSSHSADHDEPCRGELSRERARHGTSVCRARSGRPRPRRRAWRGSVRSRLPARRDSGAGREWPPAGADTPHRGVGDGECPSCGHPVRERLGDVRRLDLGGACESGDRACHPCHPHSPAPGERQTVDRARQELRRRLGAAGKSRSQAAPGRARPAREREPTPPPAEPPARSPEDAAWRPPGRSGRAAPARASRGRRRAAAACTHTRPPDRRVLRTGTCSSSPRAGSGPGRAHARRPARSPPRRPREAAAAPRGPSGETPAARRAGGRLGARARPLRDAGLARLPPPPGPTRRGAAPETEAPRSAAAPGGRRPQTEWILVTSSASCRSSGGRIPGSRRASMVLPVPGGPISRRL